MAGSLGDDALVWGGLGSDRKVSSDVPTPAYYDGDFFVLNDLDKNLSRLEAGFLSAPQKACIAWARSVEAT